MGYTIYKYFKAVVNVIIWMFLTSFLVICIYVLYHEESRLLGINFINPVYDYIKILPIWAYFVLYFILFSISSIIVFISLSLYFDIKISHGLNLKRKYYRFFTHILTSYFIIDLYKDKDPQKIVINRIKPLVKKRIQILALLESFLRIQELLTKDLSNDFKLLINNLKLQKKLKLLIFNKDFDNKILAMKVLSYLQIHTYDKQIIKYAKSENFALRTEAYAALIRLTEKDELLLNFIGENDKLSIIDINIIVNTVLRDKNISINYTALLSSVNPHKIAIGLILAKNRYIKTNLVLVLNYIGSPNNLINKLAWDALLTIVTNDDCVDIIIERFENEQDDIKLYILEKSHHVLSKRFFNFLTSIIEHQTLVVKIEIMKIFFINDFDLLETFVNSQNEEIIMAYKETSCMYINS